MGFRVRGSGFRVEGLGLPYFGGRYNKDATILGTILGSPLFGNPYVIEPRAKTL